MISVLSGSLIFKTQTLILEVTPLELSNIFIFKIEGNCVNVFVHKWVHWGTAWKNTECVCASFILLLGKASRA